MRYTRQELKQDKFKETAADAVHWSVEHQKSITTWVIVAAVLVIVIGGGIWYHGHQSDQAAAALGAAMQINNAPVAPAGAAPPQIKTYPTNQERALAAKNAFYDVSSKFGSTPSGKIAKYMAGQKEVELGNDKVAEQDFKDIAATHDSNISSLAKFALAAVYRDTNRDSDAINIYKELVAHPTESVPKVQAELALADLYSTKQPEEAKKIYAQIQKDDAKSFAAQVAGQRLSALK